MNTSVAPVVLKIGRKGLTLAVIIGALFCCASAFATGHISLSSSTYSVAENGGAAVITLSVSGNFNSPTCAVDFVTSDGTAVAGTDYTAVTTQIVFDVSHTTRTVSIPIIDNVLIDGNRTINIAISNPLGNANIQPPSSAVLTIVDNDNTLVNISAGNASVSEGNSGTTSLDMPVTLSAAYGATITVAYTTANGTALAGSDYAATSGVLTFLPGQTNKVVSVLVNGDTMHENDESLFVNLSSPTNAVIAGAQGTGTILNDDVVPNISIGDVSQSEGNTGTNTMTFTVALDAASGLPVTVDYLTADGTATVAGNDYLTASGTLTFAPGETNKTISVDVLGDVINEPDETFAVNLSNASGGAITDAQAVGTILNDDAEPTISIADSSVDEGNAGTTGLVFTVSLSQVSGFTVTVDWATADGTATVADGDYAANSGTVSFAPGESNKTVTVTVNGDTKNEIDETVLVNLSNATHVTTIARDQAVGTIVNDDSVPALSINDVSVTEGNTGTTNAVFTVSLDAVSGQTVTVDYATADGTATLAGNDYQVATGTLTFAPGETNKTITVTVNGDAVYENDESFYVDLSGPVNATITNATGTGTILNDEPLPNIAIANVSQSEGNTGTNSMTFTVTIDEVSELPVTVDYETADGTATVAANEYLAASGTLTFNPGDTNKTIAVGVLGDTINESDETFAVNLGNAAGGAIADNQAIGTILNDDAEPTVSIADSSVTEGDAGTVAMVFTVSLSQISDYTVTVDWASTNGTATVADGDYTANSGTVTFSPGESNKTVTVMVNGDTRNEADETLLVNLSNSSHAPIARGQAVGTINNDDPLPSLAINDVTVTEGDTGTVNAVFTVSLSAVSGQSVTVNYATADSTATVADNDYVAASGTLTFAPGQTNKTITVTVNSDYEYDTDETYAVNLTVPGNATIADAQGVGTILDDDPMIGIPAIYVAKLSATINRTASSSDHLNLSGRLNPSGCAAVLAGATVTVRINGVQIAPPLTLTALGFAGRNHVSSATGLYTLSFGGLDLAGLLGLPDATERGLVDVNVEVTVSDAGLDVAKVHGVLRVPYTTKQGSSTKAKFSFKKNLTLTGVFNWNKTKAAQLQDGTFSIAAKGVIEGLNGATIVPTGPVQVTVGGQVLSVPSANASLVIAGRKFNFSATGLAATGMPAAGPSAPTSYKLPVLFEVPTAGGTVTVGTVIELKRIAGSATKWRR